jgi:hypothetical protein
MDDHYLVITSCMFGKQLTLMCTLVTFQVWRWDFECSNKGAKQANVMFDNIMLMSLAWAQPFG